MAKVQFITRNELIALFEAIDGKSTTFVSLFVDATQKTNVKFRDTKQPNPYLVVRKVQKMHAICNVNYTNSVNNALLREGKEANFVASEPTYEVQKNDDYNGCVLDYNGKKMLRVHVNKTTSKYIADGRLKDFPKVAGLLKEEQEKIVNIKNISFNNIKKVYMNKQVFKVVD